MSLRQFLAARTETAAEAAAPSALQELSRVFSPPRWETTTDVKLFTTDNYANLHRNHWSAGMRTAFDQAGKTVEDLAEWLGEVEYVACVAYDSALFSGHYQKNRGWRVTAFGLPGIQCAVIGVAAFYSATQKESDLARATRLLRDHAAGALDNVPGRSLTAEDWNGRKLLYRDTSVVAGVDLSLERSGEGPKFSDLRSTTAKRYLASFITCEPLNTATASDEDITEALVRYRALALELLGGHSAAV